MVDHRSTSLPERGPTESSASEPFFFFSPIFSLITILCYNRNRGYQFQRNRIRTAIAVLKIPQPKQEPQPRFSENSQPIHH